MAKLMINENFAKMGQNYLFAEIANKSAAFKAKNPDKRVISMGIGDVTRPLCPAVVKAMNTAVDEMSRTDGFRGYPPYQGYDFLRNAIADVDYRSRGVDIGADEIYVSDGAKTDTSSIAELFSTDCAVAVSDPVYPVYVDSNIISGRNNIIYMPCNAENGYIPDFPGENACLIYLCYPNNPTGAVMSKDRLQQWVDHANRTGSVIIYDGAYKAFITSEGVPHSIYECNGARTCAIECRSFSKTAGFTGVRCGYMVIPKELELGGTKLSSLWMRRLATKSNGVSYITQRGAEASLSPDGLVQTSAAVSYYLETAGIVRNRLTTLGMTVIGGVDAPYIWLKTPNGLSSWDFFDHLLEKAQVVGTPGSGFGASGEGYFRLTSFGKREDALEALDRIEIIL